MNVRPETLIRELQREGILHPETRLAAQMSGTTSGKVYAIHLRGRPTYVLKIDSPEYVRATVQFLRDSESPLLPNVCYVHPEHHFFIYEHINGNGFNSEAKKPEWLVDLARRAVNLYKQTPSAEGWGYADEPLFDSWLDFLREWISARRGRGSEICCRKRITGWL